MLRWMVRGNIRNMLAGRYDMLRMDARVLLSALAVWCHVLIHERKKDVT